MSFAKANFASRYIPPRTVPAVATAAVTVGESHVSYGLARERCFCFVLVDSHEVKFALTESHFPQNRISSFGETKELSNRPRWFPIREERMLEQSLIVQEAQASPSSLGQCPTIGNPRTRRGSCISPQICEPPREKFQTLIGCDGACDEGHPGDLHSAVLGEADSVVPRARAVPACRRSVQYLSYLLLLLVSFRQNSTFSRIVLAYH